ncbi:MAG: thioredoxin family protein [Xenococcaceae cyanobacterium MO_207.B15]|nr:thioredoxin family protein [Xenococcaceae cyanobacterium MO_207.B15]MDJ0742060.1 thioredoxin family protein [Xenococcaceae cyanobacterium MO_167.B27]
MQTDKKLVGGYAPDFELPGMDEEVGHLGRYLKQYQAIAVIFISNQCPYVHQYLDRIKKIQADFHPQGFSFIAINSNDSGNTLQESFETMKGFAQQHNLSFPYLRDSTQDVAKSFGVQVTPEVFLLDNKSVVRYAGNIDDNPDAPDSVTSSYLRDSITSLLSGQEIATNYTEPVGTPIKWRNK